MKAFTQHTGVAAPLLQANIDTDVIIPSREMRTTGKTGLAAGMFANRRYSDVDKRVPDPEFVLNQPAYAGSSILLAGANFGCGSSREHAVWALKEFGIRCIIAPSFGAIFANNCVRNGLLALTLDEPAIDALVADIVDDPAGRPLRIDLEAQTLTSTGGKRFVFDVTADARHMLLNGLDAIGLTLQSADDIASFTQRDRERRPWAYLQKVHD